MATSARIDELLKKFEENPRRYFAPLANEYRKAGDPERAVAICEEYLPQQPGHMSGHIVYGQALFELARYDDARQVFETALSLDPENLIALRHLGDIARMAGDAHSARIWYQRVLEADPRNEEIAQLMMSLLSTPVASDAITSGTPTPLSSPAIVARPSLPTPGAAVEEPIDDPQLATTGETEAPTPRAASPAYTPFPPVPASPQSFVSRHAPKEEELLDLDSFDLGGVPLSSLRSAKSAEPELAPEPPRATADVDGDSAFDAFDEQLSRAATPEAPFTEAPFAEAPLTEESFVEESFIEGSSATFEPHDDLPTPSAALHDTGIEKAQEYADGFEPDPYAIAAKPLTEGEVGSFEEAPPGTIELAADVSLGLPDDGESSSTFGSDEEGPVDGLESFEAGFSVGGPLSDAAGDSLETESFFEPTADLGQPSPDALVDALADDSEASAGASAFSQIRDETTEPPADESSFESTLESTLESSTVASTTPFPPFPPFPEAPASPTSTPSFQEAAPAVSQGDPLMAPAFGIPAPPAELVDTAAETSDDLATIATSDTAEAEAHVPAAESSSDEPGAFVTETMATLYLEQGHFDAALDIYRQLVQQRPDDIALRDRLHAAEERAWGHQRDVGVSILDEDAGVSTPFAEDEDAVVQEPRSYGGPTIREFLTGILYRHAMAPVDETPVDETPVDETPVDETPVDETPVDEAPALDEPDDVVVAQAPEQVHDEADAGAAAEFPPAVATTPSTPASSVSDSVSTSLGALFSEADAATSSSDPREVGGRGGSVATPIGGTPAHRAPTELSLDHVFKANTSRAPGKDGFSFDQFFSEGAAEESTPRAEPAHEPRAETGDDIAQFNAWLNGLKKS